MMIRCRAAKFNNKSASHGWQASDHLTGSTPSQGVKYNGGCLGIRVWIAQGCHVICTVNETCGGTVDRLADDGFYSVVKTNGGTRREYRLGNVSASLTSDG